MGDETDKHTPESVAAKVVKALLKAPQNKIQKRRDGDDDPRDRENTDQHRKPKKYKG
jgi:hypothetical protein